MTSLSKVSVLCEKKITFEGKGEKIREYLSPVDAVTLVFDAYIPWPLFFNYDIDFQRLLRALRQTSQKYLLLCGRLSKDHRNRHAIEVAVSKDVSYDFPVIEQKAEMTMAEALLLHSKVKTMTTGSPSHPEKLPFFMDTIDMAALHKGESPLIKVKLTHFSDGCFLALSTAHLLHDGRRTFQLYRDISRAYCGKEVSVKDHSRANVSCENLGKYLNLPKEEIDKLPKSVSNTIPDPVFFKHPKQCCHLEILHMTKEVLNDLKSKVAPFLPPGSFVSSTDLMNAFLWMLSAELHSESSVITSGSDLNLRNTYSLGVAEFLSNGIRIIPDEFSGNAIFCSAFFTDNDFQTKSLIESLALLSHATRKEISQVREDKGKQMEYFKWYYAPAVIERKEYCGCISSLANSFAKGIDFGQGEASHYFILSQLPLIRMVRYVGPASRPGDMFLTVPILKSQMEKLRNSVMVKECVPGMKFFYSDYSLQDISNILKTN